MNGRQPLPYRITEELPVIRPECEATILVLSTMALCEAIRANAIRSDSKSPSGLLFKANIHTRNCCR
jgi:hypothetical protein